MSENTRIEKDPLGELAVPADALYGVQTLRAVQNFPISGLKPLPAFVDATVRIKRAAALTHRQTGRLEPRLADAIVQAADEILDLLSILPPIDYTLRVFYHLLRLHTLLEHL